MGNKNSLRVGVNAYRNAQGKVVPALAVFGDIIVVTDPITSVVMVYTPTGCWPLKDSSWDCQDYVEREVKSRWPVWAIIMTVLTFCTVVGLLFLLPRKVITVSHYFADVTVTYKDGRFATSRIPLKRQEEMREVANRVAWINNLGITLPVK